MKTHRSARPRGINTIEILGCLFAIGGGMWIGANYFGADLEGAAYQALDETELLEKVPEEWRPHNPDCPDGDCPDPKVVQAEERAQLRGELEAIREEVTRLSENRPSVLDSASPAVELSAEEQAQRDRTVAYWASLSEIVSEVADIQAQLDSLSSVTDRARSITTRVRAIDFGVRSIQALDIDGVDPRAVETGVRVAEWLGQGIEILRRAASQKTPEPVAGRAVSPEQYRQMGEVEYGKRTELVRQRVNEASAYLRGRYLIEFPPLEI